jgi:hypothetical protein
LSLGLLAPAALGLLLLLAGPLLAHLSRRSPIEEQPFGAMLLLRRMNQPLRRRRRLHDLLLLLLRMLLLGLVVVAAGQPELRWPGNAADPGVPRQVVFVLDNSLSMDQRLGGGAGDESAFGISRQRVVEAIQALPAGVQAGLVTLGGSAAEVAPLTDDHGELAVLAGTTSLEQGGTDLSGGLRIARRLLSGDGGMVYLYTDEAGPIAVPAAREELQLYGRQRVALEPRVLRAEPPANLALVDADYGEGVEGGVVRVKVANFGASAVEAPIVVRLPGGTEIAAFVDVPPGSTAEESVTVPRVAEGGVASAEVRDPALPADNFYSFHLPQVGASRVLVVDGDPGATPVASEVYFLERALAPWGPSGVQRGGVLPELSSVAGLANLDPTRHQVVLLANVSDLAPFAARLADFVRAGGGLVVGLGENATAERYNGALGPLLPASLRSLRSLNQEGGEELALPDTSLPLFQPFVRGGRAAFASVKVRRLFTLEGLDPAQSTVLLSTRSGLPVLVERSVGRGKVLLYTSTFDLGWTSFPLQAAYMPWVQRMVGYLGGGAMGGGLKLEARVGEVVSVELPDAALDVLVTGPAGPLPAQVRSGTLTFTPRAAGGYLVETPGAPPLAWVAVNTDPTESDIRPGPSLLAVAAEVDPERFVRRLPLAPYLLGTAALVALLSAFLSTRRPSQSGEEEPLAA